MKIYKNGRIFCTEFPEKIEWYKGTYHDQMAVTKPLNALNNQHNKTDREFLCSFFPKNHEVFDNFGESFFYVIPEKESPTARKGYKPYFNMELIKSNPDLTAIDVRMSREEARFLIFVFENMYQINDSGEKLRYTKFFEVLNLEKEFTEICEEGFEDKNFTSYKES